MRSALSIAGLHPDRRPRGILLVAPYGLAGPRHLLFVAIRWDTRRGERGRRGLTCDAVPDRLGDGEAVLGTETVEAEFFDGGCLATSRDGPNSLPYCTEGGTER